jgi:hypothetical protein
MFDAEGKWECCNMYRDDWYRIRKPSCSASGIYRRVRPETAPPEEVTLYAGMYLGAVVTGVTSDKAQAEKWGGCGFRYTVISWKAQVKECQ